jgi:antitoxin YefM
MTTAVSIKEFLANTDEILGAVVDGEETVIVTLEDGRKFVLVPGAEYQSLDETSYLNSTEANRKALTQSLKEADEGKTVRIEF